MKLFDKIMIIVAFISTVLVMWHVFAPRDYWIDGFYGAPLVICMGFMGYGIGYKVDI